jgi:hypothetical protein
MMPPAKYSGRELPGSGDSQKAPATAEAAIAHRYHDS